MIVTVLRRFTVVFLALSLCLTTVACGGGGNQATTPNGNNNQTSRTTSNSKLADGQYPVQQAQYNDADGEYTLFLLNATPPNFRTQNLQMARLTDDQIKQGQKTYLKVENGQPALYITEDFKIEYSFWAPFAGAAAGSLAGQAIGSLLFRPQYYVPPAYQPGGVINGYGGYGSSYNDAVQSYRTRYNAPPAVERNRTAFRTTGTLRRSYPGTDTTRTAPGNRATGSGYGGSTLKPSGSNTYRRSPSGSGFGSGGASRSRSGAGFGSRRR
jgi:hypothetical protein